MIQEYLFSDKEQRSSVKKYKPQGVQVEFLSIKGSDCWIVSYTTTGNNENSAKLLSRVNEYVLAEFKPIVLTNESAAYFNRTLYPVINEFERKLRKLLYLKSALNKSDKAADNIEDLESKDLGTIFELLFADEEFVKSVRKTVNEKTWKFSKGELVGAILGLSEETLWRKLIGEKSAPTLQDEFITVRDYRNDVMHAHNIGYEEYRKAKSLFKKINKQLDTEIGLILKIVERSPDDSKTPDYNAALSVALQTMKQSFATNEYAKLMETIQASISPSVLQLQEIVSSVPKLSPEYYTTLSRIAEDMKVIPQIDTSGLSKTLSDFAKAIQPYQESLDAIRNLSSAFNAMNDTKDGRQADDTEAESSDTEEKSNDG